MLFFRFNRRISTWVKRRVSIRRGHSQQAGKDDFLVVGAIARQYSFCSI
jgi:hypothetical protein